MVYANNIGVVGAVEKGLADFSFNLVLTGQREEVTDFSIPYEGIYAKPNCTVIECND
jgi:hypothetical protein